MPRAQRIAFICPRFSEIAIVGGAETLLRQLATHAAAEGRDVTFLTTCASDHFTWKNDRPAGSIEFEGMTVISFPVDEDRDLEIFLTVQDRICRGHTISPEEEDGWLKNNVNSSAMIEHLQTHGDDYDRILGGPYLFGLIHAACSVHPEKTVLVPCLHDEPFAYLESFKALFHSVKGLMFNASPEMELAQRLYDIPEDKCAVVGMGLDPFDVSPTAFEEEHALGAPYVVYCGRREPMKGTPILLDYLLTFRERTKIDLKIVFTGSGPIEAPEGKTDHILDLGFVSEQKKREAMAGAVAFCHPSVNESFSIVILEAWLARTPCLVNARSDVMRHQCERSNGGLWFGTYLDFEEELKLLLERKDITTALADAGRDFVLREYTWEQINLKMLSFLDR